MVFIDHLCFVFQHVTTLHLDQTANLHVTAHQVTNVTLETASAREEAAL